MLSFMYAWQDDDLEEGEVKDPSDRKIRPRPICRFFIKGRSAGPTVMIDVKTSFFYTEMLHLCIIIFYILSGVNLC